MTSRKDPAHQGTLTASDGTWILDAVRDPWYFWHILDFEKVHIRDAIRSHQGSDQLRQGAEFSHSAGSIEKSDFYYLRHLPMPQCCVIRYCDVIWKGHHLMSALNLTTSSYVASSAQFWMLFTTIKTSQCRKLCSWWTPKGVSMSVTNIMSLVFLRSAGSGGSKRALIAYCTYCQLRRGEKTTLLTRWNNTGINFTGMLFTIARTQPWQTGSP